MERKWRKYYLKNYKSKKEKHNKFILERGMTGFLCTCNCREKDCVRDAYKLLNEFADEIYGVNKKKEAADNNEELSFEDKLSIASGMYNQLRGSAKVIASRRFQVVNTNVKNLVFIRSILSNPLELVSHILKELDRTKKQRSRFLLRLLPIEVVCSAHIGIIKNNASLILRKYFSREPKTYSIIFKHRNNNRITRKIIIDDLAEIIEKMNPGNRANLKNPEIAVLIEVIGYICLISVAPDYYKYKKYNLLEICNIEQNAMSTKDSIKNSDKDREQTEIPDKTANNIEEVSEWYKLFQK